MAKAKAKRPAPVDLQELRRRNFKTLGVQWETLKNLAKQLGVSPGYASQLASGFRPFTEKTARKFEERLGLPIGWLDEERHTTPTPARIDHDLTARCRNLLIALLEESGRTVEQAVFSDLVIMAYEDALTRGGPDESYIKRLINLTR